MPLAKASDDSAPSSVGDGLFERGDRGVGVASVELAGTHPGGPAAGVVHVGRFPDAAGPQCRRQRAAAVAAPGGDGAGGGLVVRWLRGGLRPASRQDYAIVSTLPPMTIDLGICIDAARERITRLVSAAGVDPGGAVPATPQWTRARRRRPCRRHRAPTAPAATWRARRATSGLRRRWPAALGKPIADLVAEWEQTGPMMEGFLSSPAGQTASAAVMDIHTHEADLRHALGLPAAVPSDVLVWAGRDRCAAAFVGQVAGAGLPPVELDIDDSRVVPRSPRPPHRGRGARLSVVGRPVAVPRRVLHLRPRRAFAGRVRCDRPSRRGGHRLPRPRAARRVLAARARWLHRPPEPRVGRVRAARPGSPCRSNSCRRPRL